MYSLRRRLTFLVLALGLLALPASATAATSEQIATATKEGVKYLKTLQSENGSFAGFGGDWSLTAFAAAGTPAADLHYKENEILPSARDFYGSETEYGSPTWPGASGAPVTDFERASLIAYAAGIDPARTSAQQNLLAQIVAQYKGGGYYGESFNGTVFAVLAMTGAKSQSGLIRFPQTLLNQSVEAIRANQHMDGGWTFEKAAGNETALKSTSEPDMTGAAMAALCGAGVSNTDAAIVKAKKYIAGLIEANGALKYQFGANTDSNSWVVQGLNACGINPQGAEFTSTSGKTLVDFLISQQITKSGAFKYKPADTEPNEYSSQDAVRALAGAGFTVAPPTPKSGKKWVGASEFKAGKADPLSLVVEYNGTIKVCSVSLTPTATAATVELATVLKATEKAATPTGCVTSFLPTEGTGAITQINKYPEPKAAGWKLSIDGGTAETAKRGSAIPVGATIYLKY